MNFWQVIDMVDTHTPEQRSANMRAIRSKSKLEDRIASELWKRGVRYRRNIKNLIGKPDIAIKKYKIVVFIDSCFWHSCPIHGNQPKSNSEYWGPKLARNKSRDAEVSSYYMEKGWHILRIWEHEFKEDFSSAVSRVYSFIEQVKLI